MLRTIQPNPNLNKFYAIAVVSNPVQYESRYELFRQFQAHIAASQVELIVVELAFGDRVFEVTDPSNPLHVQIRGNWTEIWQKEALINRGIQHLMRVRPDWEKVAWIDGDIQFINPNFVNDTVQALEHYHAVQMWVNAIDLGPKGEQVENHTSFAYCYATGKPYRYGAYGDKSAPMWHPGFAWAMRREALETLSTTMGGPLIDTGVLGASDNHMAHALVSMAEKSFHPDVTAGYKKPILFWQDRALKFIKHDVGYVPGIVLHHWHGKKKDRGYWNRWQIAVKNQLDPETDLKRDPNHLWDWVLDTPRQWKLRDETRLYMMSRNEDSVDLL